MDLSESIEDIKRYAIIPKTKEFNKQVYDIYEVNNDKYMLGVISNKLIDTNEYETYIYLTNKENELLIVLYKIYSNLEENKEYFNKLKELISFNDLSLILQECSA